MQKQMKPSDLDPNALQNLLALDDGKTALLRDLHKIFIDTTPRRIRIMREALARGEFATLGREAHALKSGGANIGAVLFSEIARAIEAAEIPQNQLGQAVEELERAYISAAEAIMLWIKQHESLHVP